MLETKNLILRYFTLDDAEKVYLMSRETGMMKWIPDQVYQDVQESFEVISFLTAQYSDHPNPQKAPFVLGIELKQTQELIGHVGLSAFEDSVEIGYAIEDKQQRKGYAVEAVSAMSDWALNFLNLPCVLGVVDAENKNSCKVLEKSGYIFVEAKEKKSGGLRLFYRRE